MTTPIPECNVPECNEDPAKFQELGYCVFRNRLSAEEVARYSQDLNEKIAHDQFEGEPHYYFQLWRKLCCHPQVLDAVRAILGPELILFHSSVFVKQPLDEKRVEWHQDNPYWTAVRGTDVVTAWVALDDVDEENSCMKVIAGSHQGHNVMEMKKIKDMTGAMLSSKVEISPNTESEAVPIVMKAGDVSIHDSFVLHGSDPNMSNRRRAGYTIRYGNALTTEINTEQHTGGEDLALPVYYVCGSGQGLQKTYQDLRAAL
ncbi:MAG: phytanoyl-CoA dioxygenase family protein [Mariniblastus sp.]|nr:phytanoyl-CoA dioxygenase family protein [Mariniblastus sp.]